MLVKRVKPDPVILLAHTATLNTGALARYNMTRVELKTFTFSAGSKSLSIDNAVLGPVPKRLLFTMVKNADFTAQWTRIPTNFNITKLAIFRFS